MNPWIDNAPRLASWAAKTVNRRDAWGKYYHEVETGSVKQCCEKQSEKNRPLDLARLERHFAAQDAYDILGLYSLGADSMGRWAAVDLDRHDDDENAPTPEQTRCYAIEIYNRLRRFGFSPLLTESNGNGGYHVRCFFREPVNGEQLFLFARWMVRGWKEFGFTRRPESFPKQPLIAEGRYGNWLRLVGRHPKRSVYPMGYNGQAWIGGQALIDWILNLTFADPGRIPHEALKPDEAPVIKGEWTHRGKNEGITPWEEFDKRDEWEPLLESNGWKRCSHAGATSYWTRPNKQDGVSASLGHKTENGVRLFFPFTVSTVLRDGRYYTPSSFLAHVQFNGDFKAANRHLRSLGYGKQEYQTASKPARKVAGELEI